MAVTGFGLRPYRSIAGSTYNFMLDPAYQIAYNNANTFGTGDVVTLTTSGYLDKAATSSNPTVGVFASCNYPNANNTIQPQTVRVWNAPTLTSTTTVSGYVWTDPDIVYAVQASAGVSQSGIGLNANFTLNGAPNSLTGISTLQLDSTTISTTSTLPLRIVEFYPQAGNGPASTSPIVGVILNTSFFTLNTGV